MKNLWIKYREIIVYIFVGLLTTLVAYGVRFAVLYPFAGIFSLDLSVNDDPAVAFLRAAAQTLGWIVGVIFAFIPNKKWVFRNDEGGKTVWAQFGKFVASRISTYFVELALAVLLPMGLIALGYRGFTFIITVDADMLSMAISMVVVTVLNYVLSKLLVFRRKKSEK